MEVTVNPSPSQQVVAAAQAEVIIPDAKGRKITLRKPGVLAQYRLVEAVGDSASNEVYMRMVLPLIFVSAIDGDPVYPPNKKSEVEAIIQRLDEHGITAVSDGVQQHFGARDPEGDKAALKN
jgi:hypothetical protein